MRILVVEDEGLIAGNLCELIAEAGHSVVGVAADEDGAIELLRSTPADLAFIDIGLANGMTGFEVATAAAEMGVPFVFTTGNFRLVVGDFAGALGMIAKPYDSDTIIDALTYIDGALKFGVAGPPPGGLVLALPWIERLGLSATPQVYASR